jgi:hypothetical protein
VWKNGFLEVPIGDCALSERFLRAAIRVSANLYWDNQIYTYVGDGSEAGAWIAERPIERILCIQQLEALV